MSVDRKFENILMYSSITQHKTKNCFKCTRRVFIFHYSCWQNKRKRGTISVFFLLSVKVDWRRARLDFFCLLVGKQDFGSIYTTLCVVVFTHLQLKNDDRCVLGNGHTLNTHHCCDVCACVCEFLRRKQTEPTTYIFVSRFGLQLNCLWSPLIIDRRRSEHFQFEIEKRIKVGTAKGDI